MIDLILKRNCAGREDFPTYFEEQHHTVNSIFSSTSINVIIALFARDGKSILVVFW